MPYFECKGCVQRNLYLNCVSLWEGFQKILYGSLSSACNRRRHWPECVRRANGTFCFTGASYRAQLLKGRLVLNPGFFSVFKNISSDNFVCYFLRASNHQLVDKMNYTEFTVLKALTSEFKLRTNPVKAFDGTCVRLTSITFPVTWSSVLISATREWRYCELVYKFFLINNIELKCLFVQCQKYHVMIKWRRWASHLGRFTLWHNGHRATLLGKFTLWHKGRRATQLGKFTLWHNCRRTKPGLMHAPGVADIFHRLWRTMLKNMKAWSKVTFNSKLLKDERFGRLSKHRSIYALRRFRKLFKRWTLYEDRISDLSKYLKDERRGHKNHHMS